MYGAAFREILPAEGAATGPDEPIATGPEEPVATRPDGPMATGPEEGIVAEADELGTRRR
jgi:hypothetical protein